jgi:hypothetical protein
MLQPYCAVVKWQHFNFNCITVSVDQFRSCQETKQHNYIPAAFRGQPSSPLDTVVSSSGRWDDGVIKLDSSAADRLGPLRPYPRPRQVPAPVAVSAGAKLRRPLRAARRYRGVVVHKTYSTRRGALLLFSEELAEHVEGRRLTDKQERYGDSDELQRRGDRGSSDDIAPDLKSLQTVDGLAWAVLNYGSKVRKCGELLVTSRVTLFNWHASPTIHASVCLSVCLLYR